MEKDTIKQASLFKWVFVAGLLSQNLLIPVMSSTSFEDKKNYYPHPNPAGTPSPHGSRVSPPPLGTSPSYKPDCKCGSPPHPPPPKPRGNCRPPSSPKKGGGHGGGGHGGGGGYHSPPPSGGSPPTPVAVTPPTPVVETPPTPIAETPPTPIAEPPPTPVVGTPRTPVFGTPPSPVGVTPPTGPVVSAPPPPFLSDPNTPGTCNYWRSHPALIWGLFGWWATVGGAFGLPSVPGSGASGLSLVDALSNSRSDGLGALYREGTAALLNSMASKKFPFTTKQVRNSFVAAVGSSKAAAAQARIFKLANEGRLKPRN